MPSSTSHPIIFLPVPDPRSIHLLIHWIYFGRTDHIETCLEQGAVHWEGLAQNVEYLGLTTDIKIFLGRWYNNWLLPARRRCHKHPSSDDGDDDLALVESVDDPEIPDEHPFLTKRGRTRSLRVTVL